MEPARKARTDYRLVSSDAEPATTPLGRLMAEPAISLKDLAIEIKAAPETLARWVTKGVRVIHADGGRSLAKLEFYQVGGRKYTTRLAFDRFVAAQNRHMAHNTEE
jgi:hypothetical protein